MRSNFICEKLSLQICFQLINFIPYLPISIHQDFGFAAHGLFFQPVSSSRQLLQVFCQPGTKLSETCLLHTGACFSSINENCLVQCSTTRLMSLPFETIPFQSTRSKSPKDSVSSRFLSCLVVVFLCCVFETHGTFL